MGVCITVVLTETLQHLLGRGINDRGGKCPGGNVLHLLVTGDGGVITFARQPPTRYDCRREKLALIVLELARGLAFMSSTHCRFVTAKRRVVWPHIARFL